MEIIVKTKQETIGFEHGFTCSYRLHRERKWNIGLRRHSYALTGKIEVIFPNGSWNVFNSWDAAKIAVREAANATYANRF